MACRDAGAVPALKAVKASSSAGADVKAKAQAALDRITRATRGKRELDARSSPFGARLLPPSDAAEQVKAAKEIWDTAPTS